MLARFPPLCIYGMSIFIYFWPPLLYSPNLYPDSFLSHKPLTKTHKNPQKPTHDTQKSHMKPAQNTHKIHTNPTWNPHETQTQTRFITYSHQAYIKVVRISVHISVLTTRNPWFFRPTEEPWQYVPIFAFLFHLPTLLVIPFPYAT